SPPGSGGLERNWAYMALTRSVRYSVDAITAEATWAWLAPAPKRPRKVALPAASGTRPSRSSYTAHRKAPSPAGPPHAEGGPGGTKGGAAEGGTGSGDAEPPVLTTSVSVADEEARPAFPE